MPGVLYETVLPPARGPWLARRTSTLNMQGAPVVTRMNRVRFKRMVKPGDQLEIRRSMFSRSWARTTFRAYPPAKVQARVRPRVRGDAGR